MCFLKIIIIRSSLVSIQWQTEGLYEQVRVAGSGPYLNSVCTVECGRAVWKMTKQVRKEALRKNVLTHFWEISIAPIWDL